MTLGALGGRVQPLTRAEVLELAETSPTTTLPMLGRALGVSEPVIRERARRGELDKLGIRCLRLGAQWRVVTADILTFLGITRDTETAGPAPPDPAALTALRPSPKGRCDDHDTPGLLPDAAAALELSDERDLWLRRLLDAERAAYRRGYDDGRADACVALTEMQERYNSVAWWREWSAKLRRIIMAQTDPSVRMNQVLAEIAADQKFMREARARLRTKPGTLSPMEACALRRIRLANPGDAVSPASHP